MILKIVAVRDRAADCFGQPNFVASIGGAIRGFADAINGNTDDTLCRHPEDFDLFELGEYNDARAEFSICEPRQIAIGKDLKRSNGSDSDG